MATITSTSTLAVPLARENKGTLLFFLLGSYLLLIFARPFDFVPSLKVLHLPMVTGGLCLVVYAMNRMGSGKRLVPSTPVMKVLMYLSIWILLTIPFAFWVTNALESYWNDWMKVVALFVLLGNVLVRAKQVQRAVWICILGAVPVCLIALSLRLLTGESVAEGRLVTDASGLYSGPNYFSMTLMLLLPFAIMAFFLDRRVLVRVAAAAIIVIFTVTNMMTESRAGVLGEALVVGLAFWKLRSWGVSIAKTLGAVFLAMVLLAPLAPKGLWDRFSTLFVDYDLNRLDPTSATFSALTSKLEREELLIKALIMTAKHPIFGVGMNNFAPASHAEFNTGSSRDWLGCHNTFLEYSAELGILGLILYLALLYAGWKTLRRTKRLLSGPRAKEIPECKESSQLNDAATISFWGYVLFGAVAHLGYQPYFFIVAGFGEAIYNITFRQLGDSPDAPASIPPRTQFAPIPTV